MKRKLRRKIYKLLSDAGLSSLSIGTFGMMSSMITTQDPKLTFISTGFLAGGLICKIGSEVVMIKELSNKLESDESIWKNTKLYYLFCEQNRLKRVKTYIIYKNNNYSFRESELLLKDLSRDLISLNRKINILEDDKISIKEKIELISKIEEEIEFSELYNSLKKSLFNEVNVVGFVEKKSNIEDYVRTKKTCKILEFPKIKDK